MMEEPTPEEHIKIDLSQKIFDLMENAIIKESTARMLADMAVDYVMNHTMSKHLDILGRPAEKLVPLDKVKIYHLIKKYFLMIPGDDRPTNILQYTSLDDACDDICARFASIPVREPMSEDELIKINHKYSLGLELNTIKAIANHFTAPAVIEWPLGKPILADHQEGMTRSEVSRINDYRVGYNEAIDACIAAHAKAQKVDVGKLVEALESIVNHKQTTVEPTAEGFQRIAKQALEQAKR